ncbi:apolipoprotein N-acyltransferase [candidate division WOR-3 bacterium]|nr:apolipoprotein N-acyltransferase [candidate division WOR-3 bacterium]
MVPVEPLTRALLNIGVVLLFAYLGLYVGVFAWLTRRWGLWAAPLIWPLLEFLRTKSQIGFPWGLLGYSMTPYVPFIQPASVGGVYLVSAWLVLVNVLVYKLYASRSTPDATGIRHDASGVRRRAPSWLAPALGLAAAFAAPLLFSAFYVRPLKPWFNVAIIQPNVSPFDKGDWDSRAKIQADLTRLTRQSAATHPDLILYPETATLTDVTRSETMGPAIRGLADSLGLEIFTGTPLYDERRNSWHNGAVLIRPGEQPIRQRYYKIRLVPFSEKIPYADELPIIRRILGTADMGNWTRGHDYTVFNWSHGTLSALICFEAIFPDLTREFTRRGSQLLAVVTNDGWFGRLMGAQQHAELAVLRTVENGVPMIRSANNGISFIVDPYGRILDRTQLFVQTVLAGEIPEPLALTLYRRYGDWFMLACLLGLVAGLLVLRVRIRRSR